MTHKENSLRTKKALCKALRECMRTKPFSKVTVSELIRECNINRKTFYYHFEDINALLRWMLEQETFDVVRQFEPYTDYRDAFNFAMDYISENSYFLQSIYDSIGRDELKRFFYKDFIGIVEKLINDCSHRLDVELDADFKHFLCNFYTEAMAGMIIDLFQNPETCSKVKLNDYFTVILENSLPAILLSQKKHTDNNAFTDKYDHNHS